MLLSWPGRRATKRLLVGKMPGNGRDRVTDGSCERHECRSRIETATELRRLAHFEGAFEVHRSQGLAPIGDTWAWDGLRFRLRSRYPPKTGKKARETLRFEAAKAAAPYVHARLQTTTLAGDPEKPQHKVVIEFVKANGQVEVGQPASD